MTSLREGDLEIAGPPGAIRRFDRPSVHKLTHCHLRCVDFIIDVPGQSMFVEIKNPPARGPGKTGAPWLLRANEREDLVRKYHDTFLYEWAADRLADVVGYYVIVGTPDLDEALLGELNRYLAERLPVGIPSSGVWRREIVRQATAYSIDSWNQRFPQYLVTRVSAATT